MEKTEPITISVITPAYNAEKYIARAVDSVLNQTHPVDEIIVVDDGSTDKTAAIIKSYGDKIRYIHQQNAGVSTARNTGICAASGDWIAFLDADDEWLPSYIETNKEVLNVHPDLKWIISNYYTCSCSEKRRAPRITVEKAKSLLAGQRIVKDYFSIAIKGFQGCTDTILIRKDALVDVGMFNTGLHKAEDLDVWWRVAYRWPCIGVTPEPLAVYHLGIEGSGNKRTEEWKHYVDLISRHLILAGEYDRLDSYKPFISKLICGWLRSMLFKADKGNIRQLLHRFPDLIPVWYRGVMYLLTVFPRLTQAVCLLVSRVIRKLRIRRRVVVPPNASNK